MAKPLEEFVEEYSALMRELDGAAPQLKEAEQRRTQHDDAIHGDARSLGQRVGRLRAGGAAGLGLDDFKTDAEVRRILAGLDERLAQAEADRLHYQELAGGAWKKTLDRSAALEKDLALEIATRQKQATTKAGVGNKSLPDMLRLQTDVREKLDPRRATLRAGRLRLQFHKNPDYFRKKRDAWIAAELSPTLAASASAAVPTQGRPAPRGPGPSAPTQGKPASTPGVTGPVADWASRRPVLLTAAFKVSGTQGRLLFAGIRADAPTARGASKRQDHAWLTATRASALQRLKELEEIVKQYAAARQETGEVAIERLHNGRQLLAGIRALIALRARARVMVTGLSRLHRSRPAGGLTDTGCRGRGPARLNRAAHLLPTTDFHLSSVEPVAPRDRRRRRRPQYHREIQLIFD